MPPPRVLGVVVVREHDLYIRTIDIRIKRYKNTDHGSPVSAIAHDRATLVVDFFSMSLVERSRALCRLADHALGILMGMLTRGVRAFGLARSPETKGKGGGPRAWWLKTELYAQPMDYGCSTVSVTKQLPTETRT